MATVAKARPPKRWTLAEVLRHALGQVRPRLPSCHWKILRALCACGTEALGGHRYECGRCGHVHFVPHRCRNRHCPACQGAAAHDWLERQQACLLPIPYFHLVFTLPHELNPLIQQNRRAILNLLFASVSATLLEFGRNRFHAQLGLTLVLHTWGQTLIDHYHIHALVTGGGLSADHSRWIGAADYYLFPVRALSKVFRGKFCAGLQHLLASGQLSFHGQLQPLAIQAQFQALVRRATRKRWNVYAKRPFAGPEQVLGYLSRYTHRVALSERRLQTLDPGAQTVTFTYKDYADGDRSKALTLSWKEFLRRFCLHLLPERFVKIRHYGLLGNRQRHERVERARQLLGVQPCPETDLVIPATETPAEPAFLRCPQCGSGSMVLLEVVGPGRALAINDSS